MASYITTEELRDIGESARTEVRSSILKEAREISPAGATFLSHSSKDKAELVGVIQILRNHGATVYIDKKDESLPPYTSHKTATMLRSKIEKASKFILLATPRSKNSRWVPWELGIADGLGPKDKIAIFPGVENVGDTDWTEQEYLGIYHRIVFGGLQGYDSDVLMVWDLETNTAIELSEWLHE